MNLHTTKHRFTMSPRHLVTLSLLLAALTLPARAQTTTALVTIAWGAKDTHGRGVAIPAAQTSLLVFLRPGQAQSDETLKLLAPLVKDRKDVQIIGIISGDDAAAGAAQLEKANWPFPVIADTDYNASGTFTVRVWPTTVIVSPKGQQLVHIPGLPVTFSNDVPAYLDFSAGKLDQAALDKQLANREVVTDSGDQKAARHAEVARRLAERGMKDLAAAEVLKALELKPTAPSLLLSLARTDLMDGDPKSADALLGQIPDASRPPAEYNLLKGWSAIQSNRWPDAKLALQDATKLNPDPAEAYYLLGRVYEHDKDTAQAADCYRKAFEHSTEGKPMAGQ